MLHETLIQGQIFFCIFYFGILCGIIFEGKKLIEVIFKDNKIVCIILDSLFMLILSLLFVMGKNITNYGEFRIYLLIGYVLGIVIEHNCLGFLVEKVYKFIYNILTKLFDKIKNFCKKHFKRKPKQKNGQPKNA